MLRSLVDKAGCPRRTSLPKSACPKFKRCRVTSHCRGEVRAECVLENAADVSFAKRGLIKNEDVKRLNLSMLVEPGSVMVVLPPHVVETLSLDVSDDKAIVEYGDGTRGELMQAGPLTIRYGNRSATITCLVGPPRVEALFGRIPLAMMDHIVDARQQKLTPRPESPFLPTLKLK